MLICHHQLGCQLVVLQIIIIKLNNSLLFQKFYNEQICPARLWVAVRNLAGFTLSQQSSSACRRCISPSACALKFCKCLSNGISHWSLLTGERLVSLQNYVNWNSSTSTASNASKKYIYIFHLSSVFFMLQQEFGLCGHTELFQKHNSVFNFLIFNSVNWLLKILFIRLKRS